MIDYEGTPDTSPVPNFEEPQDTAPARTRRSLATEALGPLFPRIPGALEPLGVTPPEQNVPPEI